jgi:uncharacterized protein (TIGR02421 family)
MSTPGPESFESIPASLIDDVAARLAENRPVRQSLPGGGRLNIDRALPFLCVYRRNPARRDEGTQLFVNAEASFLNAPGNAPVRKGLRALVRRIARTAAARFGAFLLLEIWSGDDREIAPAFDEATGEPVLPPPAFGILTRLPNRPEKTIASLEFALQRLKVHRLPAGVEVNLHSRNHPPSMTPLISAREAEQIHCHELGLEVRPIYRDPRTGDVYPDVLRVLRRGISRALKKTFFTYLLDHTSVRPEHFYSLGRRSLPKQVWSVDRQLAEVSRQVNLLLQVTPVNAERSWREFEAGAFQHEPVFQYRPLEVAPLLLKRRLMKIATERIEDPTLAHLLGQTQDELDRQITMLADIGSRRFLPGSEQVFGGVNPSLHQLAMQLLQRVRRNRETAGEQVEAAQFARRAASEIRYYRRRWSSFLAKATVREDIYSGLLSSGGNLLIGGGTKIPARRVDALLQHEVGTHLVTYYNGQAQPLRLLQVGLAGYDALQEGLAVLSEYLVGGLDSGRLRTLAARVVAVEQMMGGATFVETFRGLVDEYDFEPRTAYTITLRVYRGGGLTKDAVYLRGLVEALDYLGGGGRLELALVGKLAVDHIPVIRELLLRGVLRQPPLRPRYLDNPAAVERLQNLQGTSNLLDLLERQG